MIPDENNLHNALLIKILSLTLIYKITPKDNEKKDERNEKC